MNNLTPEMIEMAKAARSAEELLALAKENNVEMTEDEAKTYFAQLNPKSGELNDEDLDSVAGGGCSKSEVATNSDLFPEGTRVRCKNGNCRRCGANSWTVIFQKDPFSSGGWLCPVCDSCGLSNGSFRTTKTNMQNSYEVI